MQLLLDTNGLRVTKRNNCFLIAAKDQSRLISPHRVSSIAVTRDCSISSSAIQLASKNEIPILYFSRSGKVIARLWSPYFGNIASLRRDQMKFCSSVQATSWAVAIFSLKTIEQVKNLKWLSNRKIALKQEINAAINKMNELIPGFKRAEGTVPGNCRQRLLGLEGTVSRIYWKTVASAFGKEYNFTGRTRRPARDVFNTLLNYYYGMLYSRVEGALISVGLDPYSGIIHADEYQAPSLAFDLIEPFRPLADKLLMKQCFDNQLKEMHFEKHGDGHWLSKKGKARFIPLFNDYFNARGMFGDKVRRRNDHILYLAKTLVDFIKQEKGL